MKKLILIMSVLAFLAASCTVITRDNNIYVNHHKEKDQFKISKKTYKAGKNCNNTWR